MKKVAILGRGKSLEFLSSLPDVDAYVITNNWGLELNQQFIIDRFSDNKPIIHLLSLSIFNAPGTNFNELLKHYKNFNIQKLVLPYVAECVPGRSQSYFDIEGRNGIITSEPLPDKVKPFMWKMGEGNCPENYRGKKFDLPTTGMAGVLYATAVMDPEEIYICGMDFYEKTYAFQTEREAKRNEIDSSGVMGVSEFERIPMKIFLTENIIDKFPNKKFYINTYGNYNPNRDNVVVNDLNKKKLAVVASGWHFPLHFYEQIKNQKIPNGWEVDLFCVSHRNPNLEIVKSEKNEFISTLGDSVVNRMDKFFYSRVATLEEIKNLGWDYMEEPNTMGDWGVTNQWLDKYDYKDYDILLFTHDDNFIFNDNLFTEAVLQFNWDDWLVITNGAINGPDVYPVRQSFEFFKPDVLEMLGGKFDMGGATLTRVGKVDTPKDHTGISNWNYTVAEFGWFIKNNNLMDKIKRLSNIYRISKYCFEGERGFLSKGGDDTMLPIVDFINNNFNIEEI